MISGNYCLVNRCSFMELLYFIFHNFNMEIRGGLILKLFSQVLGKCFLY